MKMVSMLGSTDNKLLEKTFSPEQAAMPTHAVPQICPSIFVVLLDNCLVQDYIKSRGYKARWPVFGSPDMAAGSGWFSER